MAPNHHAINIREVRLAAGAEFVVLICGDVMTMPGLPKVPSANKIDYVDGKVKGCFGRLLIHPPVRAEPVPQEDSLGVEVPRPPFDKLRGNGPDIASSTASFGLDVKTLYHYGFFAHLHQGIS